jgi:hypothetical protein
MEEDEGDMRMGDIKPKLLADAEEIISKLIY